MSPQTSLYSPYYLPLSPHHHGCTNFTSCSSCFRHNEIVRERILSIVTSILEKRYCCRGFFSNMYDMPKSALSIFNERLIIRLRRPWSQDTKNSVKYFICLVCQAGHPQWNKTSDSLAVPNSVVIVLGWLIIYNSCSMELFSLSFSLSICL